MKCLFLGSLSIFLHLTMCGQAPASARNVDTLLVENLKTLGRCHIDRKGQLEMISSAAHFGFRFKGGSCAVFAHVPDSSTSGYIQYELDGSYEARVRLTASADSPVIINASGPGLHEVWIFKTTEASSGPVIVTRIIAKSVAAIPIPDTPIIEFIGNSITSGAASDSSSFPCSLGNYHEHTNGYMAYGPRVARMLGLNYVVNSVSGIGIYRTWNLDSPSMPAVYENVRLETGDTAKWDFRTYSPAIVSIALGTNDLSQGDGVHSRAPFDSTLFTNKYVGFVDLIKSKYPKAQILLLSSPMISGDRDRLLRHCLNLVKSEVDKKYPADKPVACFLFRPMQPHGCLGHLSVSDHAQLAAELKKFMQTMMTTISATSYGQRN